MIGRAGTDHTHHRPICRDTGPPEPSGWTGRSSGESRLRVRPDTAVSEPSDNLGAPSAVGAPRSDGEDGIAGQERPRVPSER